MATLYFICGFIGSGKTTYSKKLAETAPAFRFSIDEWMIPLFGEHMEREEFDARLLTLQTLFQQSALQMLNLGVSVIFDFGYWTQHKREEAIQWAREHDITYEMHYLDVPFDECCKRAARRNSQRNNKAYEMTPDMLSMFWSWFEAPSSESVKTVSGD